jgi:nucleoid-associated protein YgaU
VETVRPLRTYIVRRGDTLRSIASQFYGSELDWRRIYNRNRDRISDPASLRVGQLLIIPQD